MIEQKLTNYFKRYNAIAPRAEFLVRSRSQVTTVAQMPTASAGWRARIRESLTTGGALALASLLLLVVLGSISHLSGAGSNSNGQVAAANNSFNDEALVREATALSLQVQLKDAEYFDQTASQVVRALDQIVGGSGQMQ